MKWTRTKPTVEGFYFKRHDKGNIKTCFVTYRETTIGSGWRVCEQLKTEFGYDLNLFEPRYTEWAGPIELPEEP